MRLPLLAALALSVLTASGCAQTAPVAAADVVPADTMATPPRVGPVFAGPMQADPVYDAATLLEAMHARHAATWYRTLSFTQATSRRLPDGTVSVETWREWAALPGRLRIEMDDPMAGVDVLFVGDTTYVYRDGALALTEVDRNPLLLWGFDVYAQDPAESLRILAQEGADLDAFRTDIFENRPMYVLGTPESGEVWIEQDRLLFVRRVETDDDGATLADWLRGGERQCSSNKHTAVSKEPAAERRVVEGGMPRDPAGLQSQKAFLRYRWELMRS